MRAAFANFFNKTYWQISDTNFYNFNKTLTNNVILKNWALTGYIRGKVSSKYEKAVMKDILGSFYRTKFVSHWKFKNMFSRDFASCYIGTKVNAFHLKT